MKKNFGTYGCCVFVGKMNANEITGGHTRTAWSMSGMGGSGMMIVGISAVAG